MDETKLKLADITSVIGIRETAYTKLQNRRE
jgi:hypothetical protein